MGEGDDLFEYEVDVVGGLDGFQVARVYVQFVVLQEVAIDDKGGLFDMFFLDHKYGDGLSVLAVSREELHVFEHQERLANHVVLYLLALHIHVINYNHIMNSDYDELVKIMLVGDSNVGKSSILRRFCNPEHFNFQEVQSTIGLDYGEKILPIQGKKVLVQIWDTAGQQKFQTLTPSYYRSAMGILLVFSVTDKCSFNSIELWMRQIKQYAADNVPVIILCNKIDVNAKEVSDLQSKALEKRHGVKTINVSVLKNFNITQAIVAIYNQIGEEKKKKNSNKTTVELRDKQNSRQYCKC